MKERKYYQGEETPDVIWVEEKILVAYKKDSNEIVDEHWRSSTPVGFGKECNNPHGLDPHPNFRTNRNWPFSKNLGYRTGCPTCRAWEEREPNNG